MSEPIKYGILGDNHLQIGSSLYSAEFVRRAVTTYDALVKALEAARADLVQARDEIFMPHTFASTLAKIDTALEAANEGFNTNGGGQCRSLKAC